MTLQPKVLNDNLKLYDVRMFECTAKVVPPGATAPLGKVLINLGDPRPLAGLVSRDLLDTGGSFAVNAIATKMQYDLDPATQANATDNQIIRLQGGDLLALKNGYTWEDMSPRPAWFDRVDIRYGINPDGTDMLSKRARNAVYLFRSEDAGQSWNLWSMIDPAKVADGKYSWPYPYFDKNTGVQLGYGAAGFDRTEVYQDPWSGAIYVSGGGGSGPFPLNGKSYEYHAGVIFRWNELTNQWDLYHEFPVSGTPYVMTSTLQHQLIVFNIENGTPTLHYVERGMGKQMSDGKTMVASEKGKPLNWGWPPKESEVDDIDLTRSQPCIARFGGTSYFDRVWVAYPSVNDSKMQTYAVAVVTFGGTSQPAVELIENVTAEDPKSASALMGAFVYDDMVDPDNQNTDPSCILFYWVDAPPRSSTNNEVLLHGRMFYSFQSSAPFYLSVQNGTKRYFKRTAIGHYFAGGFFWMNNELNFLAQWTEPDGIRANIVSLPPFPLIELDMEFIDLVIQPYPDPKRFELLDVRLREMSIAQRRGVIQRLEVMQNSLNLVRKKLNAPLSTENM